MTILTITGLLPDIYAAMDVVSREQIGLVGAVSRDASSARAAVGENIRSPVVGAMAAEDLTVTNVAATAPAQTINYVDMQITKARSVPFGITGEENKGLNNAGTLGQINRDRITQALRTLSNEVESDLAALHVAASRATGTAATTPFGTAGDLSDFANSLQILDDNGAPQADRHMVLGSAAIAKIRGKQNTLFKINEAGTDELLRNGNIGRVENFDIHNSDKIVKSATIGTVTATVGTAAYAVGATSLVLSAAAVALLAGDVITLAGDTNQYVVAAALSGTGGTLVIQEPGLRKAIAGSASPAITVVATATRNMFLHRSAIQLVTRAPAMPDGGDDADDVMVVQDPTSGLAFEFCVYKQKRQVRWEVNLAWGVKVIAPRHLGLLLG
jgi:hypothetical protein